MVPHAESGGDASPSSPTERRGPILSYASREQCTFRPEVSEPLVNFKCLSWLTSMTLSPITGVYLQEKLFYGLFRDEQCKHHDMPKPGDCPGDV